MNKKQLIKQWKKDEKTSFKGWDFSYIKNRYKQYEPSWNYKSLAKKLIKNSKAVLDMATGGGEVLSEILLTHKPKKVIAIEGYKPNIKVARKKLKPFNAKVIEIGETKKLPFNNEEFDLVLNRHGGLNKKSVKEIHRILSPKGIFLTQQVDGKNLKDLLKEFNTKSKWKYNTLTNIKKHLKEIGFKIKKEKEGTGKTVFKDVGALVYFLKAIPWIVDNFSVNKYLSVLKKLQKRIEKKGKLSFTSKRFLILAQKK